MAIINNGPLTNGIRGKVGDVIFQMVNGTQIVRAMPASINDPHTPRQQFQRDAFKQAVLEWRALNVEERALWDFWAYLRSSKVVRRAQRRVDGCPKPENGTNFDGHCGAIIQKSREWDRWAERGENPPWPLNLQDPPPFAKEKNLPPRTVQALLVKESLGAAWNPDPLVNYDGLWFYAKNPITPTPDSKARLWVQPPYPIHSQRIAIVEDDPIDVWAAIPGVKDHDLYIWAPTLQVGKHTIRIITKLTGGPPRALTTPFVWKWQMDMMDATFQTTKGSAVERLYLQEDFPDGIWEVWPAMGDLTPGP